MRQFLALILFAIFSWTGVPATADDSLVVPGSLEYHMKEIEDIFKQIGGSLKDPAKNQENANKAAQISALFKLTKEQMPEELQGLTEEKRAEKFKQYQEMIQQCIDLSDQWEQAFLADDNAKAKEIYRLLKDLKQDGHDEFDP